MGAASNLHFDCKYLSYSDSLCRTLSGLTGMAVTVLDIKNAALALATFKSEGMTLVGHVVRAAPVASVGAVVLFSPCILRDADIENLNAKIGAQQQSGPRRWRGFECHFESGAIDLIAVQVGAAREEAVAEGFLSTIWPVLREDCLREFQLSKSEIADEALLSMIATRIDLGVLVVNAAGLILRANQAAEHLLNIGTIICRGQGGIRASDSAQTRILRDSIVACAMAGPTSAETVVMLDSACNGPRIPVTVSRFMNGKEPTNVVTLVLPSPPDPLRVELLAKKLGLTSSEARVAVRMQQGLSNREVALTMGLKEQSISTYSKRILSKLNVNSRAEAAQMLTWIARGRGIS
jgi:DNA-binding CsgD family transcriptional regulator